MNATSVPAIIIVSYGTSTLEGSSLRERVEEEVERLCPEATLLWAHASDPLERSESRSVSSENGEKIPSPLSIVEALKVLDDKGVSSVLIVPLYVVFGEAYKRLSEKLQKMLPMTSLIEFKLAPPLLYDAEDAELVAEALLNSLPPEDECPDRILFMGHGCSQEAGNTAYQDVDDIIDRVYPGARLALLTGSSFEHLLAEWGDARKDETVLLRPFFFTIGKHVLDDMCGDKPTSWKSQLESMGYACIADLTPLGELPEIGDILVEHIKTAYKDL